MKQQNFLLVDRNSQMFLCNRDWL